MENEEAVNYETIGMNIKRLHKEKNLTREQLARVIGVERSVISKYEKGTAKPNSDSIEKLEKFFGTRTGELSRKLAVAIPDTSALLRNKRLLSLLLENYSQVVIPDIVSLELSGYKNYITPAPGKNGTKKLPRRL